MVDRVSKYMHCRVPSIIFSEGSKHNNNDVFFPGTRINLQGPQPRIGRDQRTPKVGQGEID